jgi:putative polyhydroxyalkanoate system protein
MPDIHIHREHKLGLAKARELAFQWAEEVEKKFDMECTILEGDTSDIVEFTRSGVSGELLVEANQFTLDAKLGFLMGAFAKTIESEIEKNFDALLEKSVLKKNAPTSKSKKAK